jgi:hypothetical protein
MHTQGLAKSDQCCSECTLHVGLSSRAGIHRSAVTASLLYSTSSHYGRIVSLRAAGLRWRGYRDGLELVLTGLATTASVHQHGRCTDRCPSLRRSSVQWCPGRPVIGHQNSETSSRSGQRPRPEHHASSSGHSTRRLADRLHRCSRGHVVQRARNA